MITLQLRGVLGDRFGRLFRLDAKSPAEALYALSKIKDGFESFVRNNNFHVWVNAHNVTSSEVGLAVGADDVIISVALCVEGAGGGNGALAIIAGIVIIAVAWWNPAGWGTAAQMFAYGIGAGIAAYGVGQMMMPAMAAPSADEDGNKASYGFGGAVTTVAQGNVVPVALGECWQGGFVITYRITSERVE